MREKMNVRKVFRMTAFISAGRGKVCRLDVQKIVEAFDGSVVFNADGRDHCITDAPEFCANAANELFPAV